MSETRTIFRVNETYTWLREPLLMRLPGAKDSGSLEGEESPCAEEF